jgi:pheromone shutdown protein TraB
VLLVSVMATIGTAIGQWIGITWLLAALRKG